jgi:uncharacterized membrane protein
MNALGRFLKTTVLGGAVFLVPVTIVVYLGFKAFGAVRGVLEPLHRAFPDARILGIGAATLAAIAALIVVCFLAGLVARTMSARGLKQWIEEKILCRIPGYTLIRSIAHGALGHAANDDLKPAFIHGGEGWQLGFVAESLPDGRKVVFIPEAPEALSGTVLVVAADRIQPLPVSVPEALKSLKHYGVGTAALLGAKP